MDEGEYHAARSLLQNNKKTTPMQMECNVTTLHPERPRLVQLRLDTVVIGVCTYKRPKMLAKCLSALSKQQGLDEYFVQILVVDNEAEPNNLPVVEEADKTSRFPIIHKHQPRRGIPQARNTVLEYARANDASWLVFIDDDEIPEAWCVANLMAPKFKCVPILYGETLPTVSPVKLPWKLDKSRTLSEPSMSNIRLDSRVLASGVEFNEDLALSGGEDKVFFVDVQRKRFRIAKTDKAVVYADIHPQRHTFRRQAGRAYAAVNLRQQFTNKGRSPFGAIAVGMGRAAQSFATGAWILAIVAPVAFLGGGRPAFRWYALMGGAEIAAGAGRITALFGRMPEPYRTVDGH